MNLNKIDARKRITDHLKAIDSEELKQASVTIEASLNKLLGSESGVWGAFAPMLLEPNLAWSKINSNIQWVYPKVIDQELIFLENNQNWKLSNLGVQEPVSEGKVDIKELNGVVVPALGFNSKGYRLGRGLGFYDRSFQNYMGIKVGVCFDSALDQQIPFENHDLQMDVIVTERQIIKLNSKYFKTEPHRMQKVEAGE